MYQRFLRLCHGPSVSSRRAVAMALVVLIGCGAAFLFGHILTGDHLHAQNRQTFQRWGPALHGVVVSQSAPRREDIVTGYGASTQLVTTNRVKLTSSTGKTFFVTLHGDPTLKVGERLKLWRNARGEITDYPGPQHSELMILIAALGIGALSLWMGIGLSYSIFEPILMGAATKTRPATT